MLSTEWIYPFKHLFVNAEEVSARGLKTIEIQQFSCKFSPRNWYVPFTARKLSKKYIAAEFLWYAKGDLSDETIEQYSSVWKNIKQPTKPYWNSNYGFYINPNLQRIVDTLAYDNHSRRASVMILNNDILNESGSLDTCCTYAINYCIRDNKLISKVHMRSTDLVYGFCNDIPQFGFYQEVVFDMLKKRKPDLELGELMFNTDSLHVYERHFPMLNDIIKEIETTPLTTFESKIMEMIVERPQLTFEDFMLCKNGINKDLAKHLNPNAAAGYFYSLI